MGPIFQALLATTFTYLLTALGSSMVFCVDTLGNEGRASQVMAVAAGMMLAAVTELLTSCAEMSQSLGVWSFLPLAIGFFIACSMMIGMDTCLMRSAAGALAEPQLPGRHNLHSTHDTVISTARAFNDDPMGALDGVVSPPAPPPPAHSGSPFAVLCRSVGIYQHTQRHKPCSASALCAVQRLWAWLGTEPAPPPARGMTS